MPELEPDAEDKEKSAAAVVKSLFLPVYLPGALESLVNGAIFPILPLFAQELGANDAQVGAITGIKGIAMLVTSPFCGVVVGALSPRVGMLLGFVLRLASSLLAALATVSGYLYASSVLNGAGTSLTQVGRQTFMAEQPKEMRGRLNSVTAGSQRYGVVIGSLLSGIVAQYSGSAAVFLWAAGLSFFKLPFVNMMVSKEWEPGGKCKSCMPQAEWLGDILKIVPSGFTFAYVREARNVLIPLQAAAVGLNKAQAGFVVSFAFTIDALCFPVAGYLSDKYGRKFAGVPSLLLFAVGNVLLAFATGFVTLLAAASLIGLGNAFGAGVAVTILGDLAPKEGRGEFIGFCKMLFDIGTFAGPFFAGYVSEVAGLTSSSLVCAGVTFTGMLWMAFVQPETYTPEPPPTRLI